MTKTSLSNDRNKFVLVISFEADQHATEVTNALTERGVHVLRINSDSYDAENSVCYHNGKFTISHHSKIYDSSQLTSLWYRKPGLKYDKSSKIGNWAHLVFKDSQIIQLSKELSNHTHRMGIPTVNPYFLNVQASDKLTQLHRAKNIGFKCPATLISSDVQQLRSFIKDNDGTALTKAIQSVSVPLENGAKQLIMSYKVTEQRFLDHHENISTLDYPMLLQEFLPKKYELRITVIGNSIFPCAIYSNDSKYAQEDFRVDNPEKLRHEQVEIPQELTDMCFELVKSYNLQYGAIDVILTPEGEYVFLEINPNGQYLWIEHLTGMPLTEAMANLLSEPDKYML